MTSYEIHISSKLNNSIVINKTELNNMLCYALFLSKHTDNFCFTIGPNPFYRAPWIVHYDYILLVIRIINLSWWVYWRIEAVMHSTMVDDSLNNNNVMLRALEAQSAETFPLQLYQFKFYRCVLEPFFYIYSIIYHW